MAVMNLLLLLLLSASSQFTIDAFTTYTYGINCIGAPSPLTRQCTLLHETATNDVANAKNNKGNKLRVVVVGGGWAGYSACESLSTNKNVEITLLDASSKAKGGLAGGYRSKNDRPVEAGKKNYYFCACII